MPDEEQQEASKGAKQPVQRRAMTLVERHRALALFFCRMRPESPAKRFTRAIGTRVAEAMVAKVVPLVSEREAAALERLAWGFRNQMAARGDGHLVPEKEPPRPEGERPREPEQLQLEVVRAG